MAINYYRTVLGIGVSLMTMELIIGIGVQFLQQLVSVTGATPNALQVALIMVATIILAVISHRLPQMVAGMVVGGGHNGAIGGVGMMTLFAGALTAASLAGRLSGNPAAALAMEGVGEGAKMLQDRIAAAEAAMGAQKSQGSISSDFERVGRWGDRRELCSRRLDVRGLSRGEPNQVAWETVAPRWHQKQPCDCA